MTTWRYLLASLWHYRLVHLSVMAGVAVATAVITGAFIVGDSVRGSLRNLTLERLQRIDTVLIAGQPFRVNLAHELAQSELPEEVDGVAPLLLVPGTLATTAGGETQRATQLSVFGVTDEFWELGDGGPEESLVGDAVAISSAVAADLGAKVGDELLLRLPIPSNIPADSTLGEKLDTTIGRRVQVAAILDEGISRFGIHPTQLHPRNVFLPLNTLQRTLGLAEKANLIAVAGQSLRQPVPADARAALQQALRPTLEDYGLRLEEVVIGEPPIQHLIQLSAERLVLPHHVVEVALAEFPKLEVQEVVTYLANTIAVGDRKIPYSTVSGVESCEALGPLLDEDGTPILLAEDEVVLNAWAAEDLQAEVGDLITIKYYEPETTHGQLVEKTTPPLRLHSIVELESETGQPTRAADPHFTPELPGVTDEQSIAEWDLPFQLVEEIRGQDEDYWDDYRTTPKAFVSFDLASGLWQTRWGTTSALRFPVAGEDRLAEIERRISANLDPSAVGMTWLPLKEQGLAASRGTTSFEGLFLGFSFFLMASAVMLIALLFRLGAEGRAAEVGILSATGWGLRRLQLVWLGEAVVVALCGAAFGVLAGILYGQVMIHGLTTWWVAATVTPFLELHVRPMSLFVGFAIGTLVALATIFWSLSKLMKLPAQQLLAGDGSDSRKSSATKRSQWLRWLPRVLLLAAVALGFAALNLQNEAQAGAFFGTGALVLCGLLIELSHRLARPHDSALNMLSFAGLITRNARRNPRRSILSVGLAAVASFLIVAISAFRMEPTEGGTGGFQLLGMADIAIFTDLNSAEDRIELGIRPAENTKLEQAEFLAMRVRDGEDSSCLNLYQTTEPGVVGVPPSIAHLSNFAWSDHLNLAESQSPWQLLETPLGEDDAGRPIVPVVLDKNVATYSLHLSGVGDRLTIHDGADRPVTLEVVGLLAGSVLQGNLMVSEAHFLRLFPEISGRRLFLIDVDDAASMAEIRSILEASLEEFGFSAVSTVDRLAEFLAVQNTYLSTFQSLGALGLLMGTFGLAVAQLRSVVERRKELALLRCVGFQRQRLATMVLGENLFLLLGGLGLGVLAAVVAILPHWLLHQAQTPWATLAMLLLIIAGAGLAAGWFAVRAAVSSPLLPALRGD